MKKKSDLLTSIEFFTIIVGSMMGIKILTLPRDVSSCAYEDGWISILIASIYPIYLLTLGIYISKKEPNHNILYLSKKHFGNILANILNFFFSITLLFYVFNLLVTVSYILNNYLSYFLPQSKIIILIGIVLLYTVLKDFKLISRLNLYNFFIVILLLLIPITVFKEGSILNIQPVFKSNFNSLIRGAYLALPSYFGFEIFFLIYPYVNKKEQIKKNSFISILFIILCYIWIQFTCLYYLGSDVVNKLNWPLISITETFIVPLIQDFRSIFIFLWINVILKTISNYYFFGTIVLESILIKFNRKNICLLIFPIIIFIATFFTNIADINELTYKLEPIFILYNIIYITSISIVIKKS